MSQHLHHKLAVLRQNLMHGKLPRDLDWNDVVSLISNLGHAESNGGDDYVFVIGEARMPFTRPRSLQLEMDDVSKLRRLLQSAKPTQSRPDDKKPRRTMIVAIDHHAARLFKGMRDSLSHEVDTITPIDPHDFHHHLIHKKEASYQGQRVPEDHVFYEEIADALAGADEIVLIGHGVGKSNAAGVLMEYLRSHKPTIASLVGTQEVADLSALTEPQIEALARRHLFASSQS